jgi:hypothetical protein
MAGNAQKDLNEKVRAQILNQAYTRAAAVLAAKTALNTASARAIAPVVVDAVAPSLHAEYAQRLAGVTGEQATKLGAVSLGVLTLDLVLFGAIVTRGPRWLRGLGATAVVAHTGLFVYSKRTTARVRAAARVEVARSGIRSAS